MLFVSVEKHDIHTVLISHREYLFLIHSILSHAAFILVHSCFFFFASSRINSLLFEFYTIIVFISKPNDKMEEDEVAATAAAKGRM